MSDWLDLKNKIQEGDQWRGTCHVPAGDDTFEVKIRMLTESERQDLLPRINMQAIAEHREDGESEAEQTIEELQNKEELDDHEKERLQDAQTQLAAERGELVEALGKETFAAIRAAGKLGIVPDEADVNDVFDAPPSHLRERFADIEDVDVEQLASGTLHREEARAAVKAEMRHWLEESVYPVSFTLGQTVFRESQGRGNSNDDSQTGE